MAKTKKKNRPAPRRPKAARGGLYLLMLGFGVVTVALFVVAAPALILLFVGMAPTAVAILIDRDPEKHAAISVAMLNFAGLSPYLADFVLGSASLGQAMALVSNVFVLVIIYGAAAAGWVLVLILPPVTSIVLASMTEARIEALRKEQKQLVEDWGEGVTGR
jgi:polyferredoxin